MTSSDHNRYWKFDYYVIFSIIVVVSVTIGMSYWISQIEEFSNNITLMVEIGVGVIITIIVFRTTKKAEKNNKDTLKEIKRIVGDGEEFRELKNRRFKNHLRRRTRQLTGELKNHTVRLMTKNLQSSLESFRDDLDDMLGKHYEFITADETHIVENTIKQIENHIISIKHEEFIDENLISLQNQINKLKDMSE